MFKQYLTRGLIALAVVGLAACGGGGGGSESDDDNDNGGGDDQSHYAGRDCMASGCHDSSMEAENRWTYAGTVYTDGVGSAVAPGATVVITQDNGTVINLTADSLGNFWTRSGTPTAVYTARVNGGTSMVAKQTNGSCSASRCHSSAPQKIY